jgi:hypothetical protein
MKKIKSLPAPLQKQIVLRLCLGVALLIVGLVSAIMWCDVSMLLIIAVAALCVVLGVRITYREYIVIQGVCDDVSTTILRGRTKAIVLSTEIEGKEIKLRVALRQQFKKIAVGDALEVYVDAETQIHEWDGEFRLQSYIAIDKRPATCYTNEVK